MASIKAEGVPDAGSSLASSRRERREGPAVEAAALRGVVIGILLSAGVWALLIEGVHLLLL